jgi:hypothetical protein
MTFQPGQSGNSAGYDGPRSRRHRAVIEKIKGMGHEDCLVTLSTIQNDEKNDIGFRIAAANALAPYAHPKLQSIPVPRFIDSVGPSQLSRNGADVR